MKEGERRMMKRQKTQQAVELTRFPITLASDGVCHVIKPQDWKVFSLRCKDDRRRETEDLGLGLKIDFTNSGTITVLEKNLFPCFKIHAPHTLSAVVRWRIYEVIRKSSSDSAFLWNLLAVSELQ
jgi:hypothetical protein